MLKLQIINSTLSYLKNNTRYNITRQDIYLWIDKSNIPEIEYESIQAADDTLYIIYYDWWKIIDEKFIHEQLKAIIDKTSNNTKKILILKIFLI